jgi:16S rRNA processing protein RimM
VVLGQVVGAHGIRGQVRIRYYGDGPARLIALPTIALADGTKGLEDPAPRIYDIQEGGAGRSREVRLSLEGVTDRSGAEALKGRIVLGERADLPPLDEGEYYWFELIGCRVEVEGGEAIGTVRELWETGAHDVLVVRGSDGRDRLIPTARELMTEVDLEARRIVVADLPGLMDPI